MNNSTMSSHLGPLLARGGMADVYAWGDRDVLKLYRPGCTRDHVERERVAATTAWAAGIRAPAVRDVVEVDGRVGLVFERIIGPTLLEVVLKSPRRVEEWAGRFATCHAAIHACSVADLPDQRDRFSGCASLPGGTAFCHGDFQPGNVLLADDGPVVIDWFNATRGDPAGDVAVTLTLLHNAVLPAKLDSLRTRFSASYLHHYRLLRPMPAEDLARWLEPVALARSVKPLTPTTIP